MSDKPTFTDTRYETPIKMVLDAVMEGAQKRLDAGQALGAGCPIIGGPTLKTPPAGGPGGMAGCGCGGRRDMRRDDGSVEWLLGKSPRLALARALGIDMIPFEFVITANFATAGNPAPLTDQGPNKTIGRDVLLYALNVDIQTPNAFTGDELKPLSDLAYDYTSGIQQALNIYGDQRRRMPYAPLKAFPTYCSSDEPWVVAEEQIPSMDFNVTTALPSAPTIITCTFVGKTPAADTTFRMSPNDAFGYLEMLGYCVDLPRKFWGC